MLYDSVYMKSPEQKVDLWLPGQGRRGEQGVTADGPGVSFWDEEMF